MFSPIGKTRTCASITFIGFVVFGFDFWLTYIPHVTTYTNIANNNAVICYNDNNGICYKRNFTFRLPHIILFIQKKIQLRFGSYDTVKCMIISNYSEKHGSRLLTLTVMFNKQITFIWIKQTYATVNFEIWVTNFVRPPNRSNVIF